MSALVGYDSSDEENHDARDERPAKIARIADSTRVKHASPTKSPALASRNRADEGAQSALPPLQQPPLGTSSPAPGPSIAPATRTTPSASAPGSPYTTTRQRIHDLTMPTLPNFDIPSSPSPPPPTSEEAATLAATTKKFERFLALKQQEPGVHFNERLAHSAALRNPALLEKLMAFARIGTEESYASTLSVEEGLGVPGVWDEECYVENLVRENDRLESKGKREGGGRVEFVAETKSRGSSARGTPSAGEGRKSRFDK